MGVIPILLAEMSPPGFRATFPGVTYQLGNMISSSSAQIEATGGDHLKTTIVVGGVRKVVDDYARVQGILIGTVAVYIIFLTIIAPENHGSNFEQQGLAFESGSDANTLDRDTDNDEKLGDTSSHEKV
jgi:SHS family lactate transporter-like MFS transporter